MATHHQVEWLLLPASVTECESTNMRVIVIPLAILHSGRGERVALKLRENKKKIGFGFSWFLSIFYLGMIHFWTYATVNSRLEDSTKPDREGD